MGEVSEEVADVKPGDVLIYNKEDAGGVLFSGKSLEPGVEYTVVDDSDTSSQDPTRLSASVAGRLLFDGVVRNKQDSKVSKEGDSNLELNLEEESEEGSDATEAKKVETDPESAKSVVAAVEDPAT